MALRVLLACIESHAKCYKRYIVPVLSVKMDFYVSVFVRIYTSVGEKKNTPLKVSYVYQCVGCDSFHLQPLARLSKVYSKLDKVVIVALNVAYMVLSKINTPVQFRKEYSPLGTIDGCLCIIDKSVDGEFNVRESPPLEAVDQVLSSRAVI
nr:probable tRNA (guanine(26)-N(2))-dimethyltransferase 1 [Tanacetum cinerariifolium]